VIALISHLERNARECKTPASAYRAEIPFARSRCPLAWIRFIFEIVKLSLISVQHDAADCQAPDIAARRPRRRPDPKGQPPKRRSAHRSKLPTTCKLVMGCCYVREENPSCFGSSSLSLVILDLLEKEGPTEVEIKFESADVAAKRSADVGRKARHSA
jgi:hypothetical protein